MKGDGDYYATLLVGFSGTEIIASVAVGVESVGGGNGEEGREEEKGGGIMHC